MESSRPRWACTIGRRPPPLLQDEGVPGSSPFRRRKEEGDCGRGLWFEWCFVARAFASTFLLKQLLEGEEPGVQIVLKYPEKFLEELEGEKGHPLMVHHDAERFLPGDERRQFGE